jgi:hypothetical protein
MSTDPQTWGPILITCLQDYFASARVGTETGSHLLARSTFHVLLSTQIKFSVHGQTGSPRAWCENM